MVLASPTPQCYGSFTQALLQQGTSALASSGARRQGCTNERFFRLRRDRLLAACKTLGLSKPDARALWLPQTARLLQTTPANRNSASHLIAAAPEAASLVGGCPSCPQHAKPMRALLVGCALAATASAAIPAFPLQFVATVETTAHLVDKSKPGTSMRKKGSGSPTTTLTRGRARI